MQKTVEATRQRGRKSPGGGCWLHRWEEARGGWLGAGIDARRSVVPGAEQ